MVLSSYEVESTEVNLYPEGKIYDDYKSGFAGHVVYLGLQK